MTKSKKKTVVEYLFTKEFVDPLLKIINGPSDGEDKMNWKAIHDYFDKETLNHLNNLDKSNLKPIETFGYEVSFVLAWNAWLADDFKEGYQGEWQRSTLCDGIRSTLSDILIFASVLAKKKKIKYQDIFENQKDVNFFKIDHGRCQKTDAFISLRYDKEGIFQTKLVDRKFEVITENCAFENSLYEVEVEFTSGNLIIMDWFRFDDNLFNQIVKDENFSINSSKGRVDQITHYAEKHNFISVNVGNSSPSIFKRKNTLMFGRNNDVEDSEEDKSYVGFVCTDLWNASIIDEDQLKAHLAETGISKKEINAHIRELKKGWTCNQVKVEPGKYKAIFCGDYEDFDDKFREEFSPRIAKKYNLYFILKKV